MKAYCDQHFLIDPHAVGRIADITDVRDHEVLEVGPGNGALTKALLDRGAIVHAVELDPEPATGSPTGFPRRSPAENSP